MKLRLSMWAAAGALVVLFWTLYIPTTAPAAHSTIWTLAYWTCPIALARHYALSFYGVLLANAATYALAGAVLEALRGHLRQTRVARYNAHLA